MTNIYCRIITTDCSKLTEESILSYFKSKLGKIEFSPMQPYWKIPGQGDITCHFTTSHTLDDIQHLFADHWDSNTADSRRSNIHCPGVFFLWISR